MSSGSFLVGALAIYAVSTLISMAVMNIGAFIAALGIVFYYVRHREKLSLAWRREVGTDAGRRYFFASVALSVALVTSLVFARVVPSIYGGKPLQIHVFKDLAKLWYLYWPLFLVLGIQKLGNEGRRKVLLAWLSAFTVLSVIGIAQFFTGWPRPQVIPGNEAHFHTTLFLGHHLSVASIFIFPFFAVLELIRKKPIPRSWLIAAGALGCVALLGTYSRMLWVALPIGLLAWSLFTLPRKWGVLLAIAVVLGAGLATQQPKIHSRLFDPGGVGDRETLWKLNLEFFRARPLTGTGWRHNEEASAYVLTERSGGKPVFAGHAHSNVLDLLGGTGLLGFVAWIFWWVVVIRIGFQASRTRAGPESHWNFAVGVLCAFLVFQLNGLTQVNFWEGKVEHQLAWAVAWLLFWAKSAEDPLIPAAPELK